MRLVALVCIALIVAPASKAIDAPLARGLVTAKTFWNYCDSRKKDEIAKVWCYTFIYANIDALIVISQSLSKNGKPDPVCLGHREPPEAAEAVLAEISKVRSSLFDAATMVQIGIGRVLHCSPI